MPKFSSDDVFEIADQLKFMRGKQPVHFLIGAGCSVTAKIPSASELVAEIQKTFAASCLRIPADERNSYGACMGILTSTQRRIFIRQYIEKRTINWGTIALAQLIVEGFISRVLTLNFDVVLENACGLLGLQPAVYDFGVAPAAKPDMIVSPAIIHLHGQSYGLVLLNTDQETEKHRKKLQPILSDTLGTGPLIVAGYSGSADGIFNTLLDEYSGDYPLYWLSFDEEIKPHIRPFAEKEHFTFLGGADFDRFMIELAQALGCWPPRLFADPLQHLLDCLTPVVSQYPVGSSAVKIDLLRDLTAKVKSWQTREAEDQHRALHELYMKRNYPDVANSYYSLREKASREDKDIAYWSFIEWADLLSERAEKAGAREASELYEEAATKYGEALKINRDGSEALYNWGTMLSDRAENASHMQAAGLYAAAREKYEASLAIKGDDFDTLRAFGDVVFEQSELAADEVDAAGLRKLAGETYRKAHGISPKDTDVLKEWGNLLFKQAKADDDEEGARAAFRQAEQKYREARRIKEDAEVLVNLGNLYSEWVAYADDKEAARLAESAIDMYEKASLIKPNNDEMLVNWGNLLSEQAKVANVVEAARLFSAAGVKYEKALQIEPNNPDALYNWANLLAEQGRRASGENAAQLFALAGEKYQSVTRIRSDASDALNNWADMLIEQSRRAEKEEALALLAKASEKVTMALSLTPNDNVVLCSAAVVLSEQARLASGEEAARKYKEADEKFAASLQAEPDYSEGLSDWGASLLEQAKRAGDPAASQLFTKAAEKLEAAARIDPSLTFNLACLAALRGDESKCRANLENASKYGALPPGAQLIANPYLESVRDRQWFRELPANQPL